MEVYATVASQKIFCVKEGEAGLPIVFIHGVPTSSHQWRPVQKLLSPYFTTYNIDLIGMGKSDKPLEGWEYTFANDAKILAGLMDEWGHERMIVAGDDWGGGIALTFAALYPQRTELCITIDPVAYEQWPIGEIESVGRLHFIQDNEEFQKVVADFPMKLALTLRTMLYKPWNLTGLDMRAYREPYETVDYARGGSLLDGEAGYGQPKLGAIRALAKRAAALDPRWMMDLDYAAIRSPVLILWGAQDGMMDPAARFRLKNDIVNAPVRVQLVEQAGHLSVIDRPEFVAEAMLDFISEHRGLGALARPYTGGLVEE
jgi:2-hydroxymuconate-semialdehyde hydrolase